MIWFKKILKVCLITLSVFVLLYFALSLRKLPEKISYGVSFSKFHTDELGLSWQEVYTAILDDLRVQRFRLSAHWPMVEAENGKYDFSVLDTQLQEAEKRGAKVILGVGRRLPGWPECHIPDWAKGLSWEEKKENIRAYIEATVTRYKDSPTIEYWQAENEPFLSVFAKEHCGELDEEFLKEEISLIKKIDGNTPVLVTDSGNLGLWKNAWEAGDAFGTSVYMYLWNPTIGEVKSVYLPSTYRVKTRLLELFYGKKKNFLIELSLEPWLLEPIAQAPLNVQLKRMNIEKFDEIISFAKKTGFEEQYLWGAEWWYWMKLRGESAYWDRAKELFGE